MTDTPTYQALLASHDVDPDSLTDTSLAAVEKRSTAADRERGAQIVARLEGGEG